jgi:hypothetical protein
MQRRVRESATYLAQAGDGELAQYIVRLCELLDGRWLVHLMALPWDNHVAENTFATAPQACAAADALYAMGLDGGRWDIRRWGWRRPESAAGPAYEVGAGHTSRTSSSSGSASTR